MQSKILTALFLSLMIIFAFVMPISCGDDDDDDDNDADVDDDLDDDVDDDTDDDVDDDTDDDMDDDVDDDVDDDTDDDDDPVNVAWQDPPSVQRMDKPAAEIYCADLDVDDHTDWRLPTISELRSFVVGCADTELGGDCPVKDTCTEYDCRDNFCNGCDYQGGPGADGAYWADGFSGGADWYWSSTIMAEIGNAWCLNFASGQIDGATPTGNNRFVRCVYTPAE